MSWLVLVTERDIVLTKPISLDGDTVSDYRAPNIVRRILSLFKNVRPGSDLSSFQLPPLFNIPKSQLQCYGESVYAVGKDMLKECNDQKTSLRRFVSVVAWSIATVRPLPFGFAPYNPVLGETHHVSRGSLNVLLEQVCHHPPVTALHATDEEENTDMVWCHHPLPRFLGTKVEAEVHGKKQLKLLNHGETYVMNSPKLSIRFFPPGVEWVGNVKICCEETSIEADLCYTARSFLGRRGPHAIQGKIYETSSLRTLYVVDGHWNSTVKAKDVASGEEMIIYDAKEVLTRLKAPEIRDSRGISPTESCVVWSEVSRGIMSQNWSEAREAKNSVESKQRELAKERESKGENWVPKHFHLAYNSKEAGWECSPIEKKVPPAPIVLPFNL
ncbi:hypothetical protein K2173_015940 [Erythroxylum novogranatense]|uniref:Oxysterol-binding protein n=1 Tax=Erythroxylum novogranatense TaxID=1862640 RepID=A0AAV8SF29_9ROSI|nr:hypothetical protein K2173_015940 [Erythroxylum novogranatense]